MTTTAQNLIDETKRLIFSSDREQLNRLNGAITNSATSLTFEYAAGGIVAGAVLSIDLELLYVWAVSGQVATVQRGYLGSTGAAHADDAIITVNPRYSDFAIFQALNAELDDLSSPMNGLFQVRTVDVTNSISSTGFDLSMTGFIDVLEVQYRADTASKWWRRLDGWRVINNAYTTDFASGRALIMQEQVPIDAAIIRVTYKSAFVAMASASSDIQSVCGLPATANDIPPLGAAARLTFPRDIKRAFDDSQGEPRRASEVPPNASSAAAQTMMAYRARRISAEHARLKAMWPTRLVN